MSSHPSSDPDENPASAGPGGSGEKYDSQPGEADLWELESDFTPPEASIPQAKPQKFTRTEPMKRTGDEPTPASVPMVPRGPRREELAFNTPLTGEAAAPPDEENPSILPASKPSPVRRKVTDTFADLEDESEEVPAPRPAAKKAAAPAPEPVAEESPATDTTSETEVLVSESAPAAGFTLPKIQLTKLEKICLIAFLALLAATGIFYHAQSLNKLPEKKAALTPGDFPIKGKRLTALEIKSYWREPIADDRARIGTSLLPVVELKLEGGPASVRVRFRDSTKKSVGDQVTRQINGQVAMKIPSTVGFEEIGMYASYRTGDTPPWIIEVLEGPPTGGTGDDFKVLFEMPVSTERR